MFGNLIFLQQHQFQELFSMDFCNFQSCFVTKRVTIPFLLKAAGETSIIGSFKITNSTLVLGQRDFLVLFVQNRNPVPDFFRNPFWASRDSEWRAAEQIRRRCNRFDFLSGRVRKFDSGNQSPPTDRPTDSRARRAQSDPLSLVQHQIYIYVICI